MSNRKYQHFDLTTGSVSSHIIRMAPPMAVAFLAMMIFNIVDTWFVSRLGDQHLAAMGFTFPVVMLIHAVAMGMGLGTSAAVSQAFGKGDKDRIRLLATSGLILGFGLFVCISILGLLFIRQVFAILGASGETLSLTTDYMKIWFWFLPFGVLPMVGNNAIRATGDTLRPSIIMITGAIINCILDPLFIFGPWIFPEMGIAGAALATGLARTSTLILSLAIMHRFNLLTRAWCGWRKLCQAWLTILKIAAPATATNLLMPLTNAVITRIIAGFGTVAVAATAAGQRVEMFAFLVPMAMGSSLVPIIGQNWGARRLDRVRHAFIVTNWYGVAYAGFFLILSIPMAPFVAQWFSETSAITTLITHYLWIMLCGSLFNPIVIHAGFALNSVERPAQAAALNFIRLLGLLLPMAWIGSKTYGIHGVYIGMTAASILSGIIALIWFLRVIPKSQSAEPLEPVYSQLNPSET